MEFLKALAEEVERLQSTSSVYAPRETSAKSVSVLAPRELSPLTAAHVATVFELLTDELEVLGSTLGATQPDLRTSQSTKLSRKNRPVYKLTYDADKLVNISMAQHYESVIPRRMMQTLESDRFWSVGTIREWMSDSKIRTDTAAGKFQFDRTFLHMIADNALREMLKSGTSHTMAEVVREEKATLKSFWSKCIKLVKDRATISRLKREIKAVDQEKRLRVRELDGDIFKLMDSGLEINRRNQLEASLTDKQAYMIRKRFKRRHRHLLYTHHSQIALCHKRIKNESKCHLEMMKYLHGDLKKLETLLERWMEKHELDLNILVTSLEEMKEARQKDLERAEWLTAAIKRMKPIVKEDRRLKTLEEAKRTRTELEHKKATKCQAWWRGTMVRNQLGPYRPVPLGGKKGKK